MRRAKPRRFLASDIEQLIALKRKGLNHATIAKIMRRPANSIHYQLVTRGLIVIKKRRVGPSVSGHHEYDPTIPAYVIAAREKYLDAPRRDLTASVFGDPPVGYSSLDRA